MTKTYKQIVIEVIAETNQFNLEKVNSEISKTTKLADAMASGQRALRFGATAYAGSVLASVLPMTLASKALASFDQTMSLIAGVGGAEFSTRMDEMMGKVRELSATYGASQDDIADAMYEFVKSGRSANEVLNQLMDPAMKLATANAINVADAVTMMNQAWVLFGDQGYTADEMMNMIHVTANESLYDVEDFGNTIRYAGSQASLAGANFEEFLAVSGALSQVGGEAGEEFGTLIARMMTSRAEVASILGTDVFGEDGNLSFTKLMDVLKEYNGDQAKAEELANKWTTTANLGGNRAYRVLAQLIKASGEYDDILESVTTQTRALDDASNSMQNNLTVMWNKLKNAILIPLENTATLDAMRYALQSIVNTLSSDSTAGAIRNLIMNSAEFVNNYGPELVQIITQVIKRLIDLGPTLIDITRLGNVFLKIVLAIPSPILAIIAGLITINKIMPVYSRLLVQAMLVTENWGNRLKMAGTGMSLALGGMLMFLSSEDPLIKAFGAIAVAIGGVTTAFSMMAIAENIALGGALTPAMVKAGAMTVGALSIGFGAVGGLMAMTTPKADTGTGGYESTNYYNNVTINVSEPSDDWLEKEMAKNGVVFTG